MGTESGFFLGPRSQAGQDFSASRRHGSALTRAREFMHVTCMAAHCETRHDVGCYERIERFASEPVTRTAVIAAIGSRTS
jgi:hypothetical protein